MSAGLHEIRQWLSLFAAVFTLSLAVVTFVGGRRSPLGKRLAALCFVLFGWNFSTLAHHLHRAAGGSHKDVFSVLDSFFTALSPALVLEVVLTFVGASRRYLFVRVGAWALFGGLALVSLGAVVSDVFAAWTDGAAWAQTFLVAYAPLFVFEVVVLIGYLRSTTSVGEKSRARMVLAALAIGSTFSMSDVVRGAGAPLPYLGAAGTVVAAALLATLVLRSRLLERDIPLQTMVYVAGMVVAVVVAYLIVVYVFSGKPIVQVFGASGISIVVAAVARELAVTTAESRARNQRLYVLGRFSAQMAHDIKSPLTALLGAAGALEGVDDATRKELLDIVSTQARRVAVVVDRYDRIARVEPRTSLVRIDDVAMKVGRLHGLGDAQVVRGSSGAQCEADFDLMESALENVVRNAIEATGSASLVRIETLVAQDGTHVIRVVDRGPGMPARVLEQALDDFFTTKPEGTGLGLAFSRRVLEAHGGTLSLASRVGPAPDQGTTVELRLPFGGTSGTRAAG